MVSIEPCMGILDTGLGFKLMKYRSSRSSGFTIVELLIVIVVIGILAAITIVAYNGITKRSTVASIQSELAQNAKALTVTAQTSSTSQFSTADAMPSGAANLRIATDRYKLVTYCTDGTSYVLLVLTNAGDTFYTKNGAPVVQDNVIDDFLPCASFSIANAKTTYLNLPASCAGENGTCTITGTATIVYGSAAGGQFNRKLGQTGTVTCSNAVLTDSAPGLPKACYAYPN